MAAARIGEEGDDGGRPRPLGRGGAPMAGSRREGAHWTCLDVAKLRAVLVHPEGQWKW
jgi:hypothetical protein